MIKLFRYADNSFQYLKSEFECHQSIRQIVEIDPHNNLFAVVYEEDDGISILKLEFGVSTQTDKF